MQDSGPTAEKKPQSGKRAKPPDLAAGDFSAWLRHARRALISEEGTEVACGQCIACCNSSYFIHIRPEETGTLSRIGRDIPVAAPGMPKGHVLLGYDKSGVCPMLARGVCAIYEHRPLTCRNYDCRIFAAAGIAAGGKDKARINQRVRQWKFSYPGEWDRREQEAVKSAAKFIREHAACFPGGKVPDNPSQLAILAIKAYEVFLSEGGRDQETANAVVEACRAFDAQRPPSGLLLRTLQ